MDKCIYCQKPIKTPIEIMQCRGCYAKQQFGAWPKRWLDSVLEQCEDDEILRNDLRPELKRLVALLERKQQGVL